MKVELDKIGQGCDWCAAKPAGCKTCERNPNLVKLTDNFVRLPKTGPSPNIPDDGPGKILGGNRGELAGWGIRLPIPLPKPTPPPAPQQKSSGADVPPPDVGT